MGRLFGTDGIRGVANRELGCELAMLAGRAAAKVMSNARRRPLFAVGMDTRLSSPMLSRALSGGLCSVGADVLDLGEVPTPAVAYLVGRYKADAGVMISASHNSAEYNGIKIFGGSGYKLPDALEEEIESLIAKDGPFDLPSGDGVGKLTQATDAVKIYVDHLKSTVLHSPEGLRIAVDCANGAASLSAVKLMRELGVDAQFLFHQPDGLNINRACGSTHMEALSGYVVEHGLDAGVAFDGDADRCLCVDEKGEIVDGDQMLAFCALDMKKRGRLEKNALVGTVLSNLGLTKFCEANGMNFVATKVGDRFVLEEMLQEEYTLGGEQSGHLIFRDFATTGDGELTAIQVLSLLKREGTPLSVLASQMKKYPQAFQNVRTSAEGKLRFYTDDVIQGAVEAEKKALGASGRVIVRVSGTEPLIRVMTEGESTSFTSMGSQVRVLLRPPTRKSLEKSRLFLFSLLPRRGCIFPCRQGAILDVNELNKQSVHASRCERVPGVDVNSLPVSM